MHKKSFFLYLKKGMHFFAATMLICALNESFMLALNFPIGFQVSISYLEIYNELIKDLLNPSGPLELREDNRGQRITVAGLSEITATNRQEVIQLLIRGNKQRTMEPTLGKYFCNGFFFCFHSNI